MTDNTPDFDSMSPEELMKWMESLAVRQGADEGLTTSADMDIAEVDPNSVVDEPGYIPYGMDEEEWEKRKAEEERVKAEKRAARAQQQQSAPPPAATPAPQPAAQTPPPAPAPEPEPAPAAPAASGGQPDFDNMSPEELMKWMESLAVRQGADEGLTTSADMQIDEIDPNSVEVDEPGYIPYGMDTEEWERRKAEEERVKAEKRAAKAQQQQSAPPPAPAPTPEPPAPTPQPAAEALPDDLDLESLFAGNNELPTEQPAASQPAPESLDLDALFSGAGSEIPEVEASPQDSMAWLESLSADQGDEGGLGIDLAGLGEAVTSDETAEEDPMAWLEGLASAQANQGLSGLEDLAKDVPEQKQAKPDQPGAVSAPSGDNTQEWLESLAKAQGANEDEFVTSAGMPVPGGGDVSEDTGPGYTDFTIESPPEEESYNALDIDFSGLADDIDASSELEDMEDPNDWLTALVTDDGVDEDSEELDIDLSALTQEPAPTASASPQPQAEPDPVDIMGRLNQGGQDVSRDEMENFLSSMLEKGAQRTDVTDYIDEDDEEISAELEQAELPDWLVEQVGTPPPSDEPILPSTQPLVDNIVAPEMPDAEMPDWIQEDVIPGDDTINLEDIFADTEDDDYDDDISLEELQPASRDTKELRIDDSDPWVEAFEEERQQGEEIPAWYLEKLGQTPGGANAAVETTEEEITIDLAESPLPDETELAEAKLSALPEWMNFEPPYYGELQGVDTSSVAEEPVVAFVMEEDSDDSGDSEEMPDWLLPNMETGEDEDVEIPDWLAAAGVEADDTEIPEWLRDTFGTEENAQVVDETPPAPAPTPEPIPAPVPVSQPAPTPAPAPKREAPQIVQPAANVTAAITAAREKVKSGSVDDGLKEYESVIRANTNLDVVVSDLETMIKDNVHKSNPAIYRVLGDGLMRQGKLQTALDTYRKALNLL